MIVTVVVTLMILTVILVLAVIAVVHVAVIVDVVAIKPSFLAVIVTVLQLVFLFFSGGRTCVNGWNCSSGCKWEMLC